MKKNMSFLLILLILLSLCACGNAGAPAATASPATETAAPAEPAAEPEVTADPAPLTPAIGLAILFEQDDSMINNYSLLAVSPQAPFQDADGNAVSDVALNTAGADALINWLLGPGADLAAQYGFEDYGEYLFYLKDGRPTGSADIPAATEETKRIRISTTTSVNDSGLLGALLPVFEADYGYEVEVFSAGTGKAIANAKMGNADLLLVHSKTQEEAFIADGYARIVDGQNAERLNYMYNYFVLVGPTADPAGVAACATVKDAFAAIAAGKYLFISRGDKSGTHTAELKLWPETLGITDDPASFAAYVDWYQSSNAGMYVCLTMANEQGGYVFSDKATFLTFQANGGLPQA